MDPRPRHRRLLVPALLVTLAVELSLVAAALGPATFAARAQPGAAAAVGRLDGVSGARDQGAGRRADRLRIHRSGVPRRPATSAPASLAVLVVPSSPTPAAAVPNVAVAATSPSPAIAPKPVRSAGSTSPPTATYRGRNHVWIPALGVNRSVSFYACSRATALANVVYRWGCAGKNNVYLMGHAGSVFRALNSAYVNGRLRKGMQVIYADANGRVTRYRVTFWKVVSPVGAAWAYASQASPSLTLQTCVGARSQYRLVVRLVASG